MSPVSFRPSSAYNRPPPQLQLISRWKDSTSSGSSYDGTPRLQLVSPRRSSSYVNTESSSQLLLMPQQNDSSAGGCEQKSPLPLQRDSSYTSCEDKSSANFRSSHDPSQETKSDELSDMLMCRVCHQVFTSSDSLKLHMTIHTPTWPKKIPKLQQDDIETSSKHLFSCGTCGKYFKDSQALKFHRYNHILRFPCNLCGRRFSRSWNLLRHKKTHYKSDEFVSIDSSYVDSPVSTSNDQLFTLSSTENEHVLIMSSTPNDPAQPLSSTNNGSVLESSVDLTTEMDTTGGDDDENRSQENENEESDNKDVAELLS